MNGNAVEMKVLKLVKDPGFCPTMGFENKLAANFLKKLHFLLSESDISRGSAPVLDLEELLFCICAVAEKDSQFIAQYFIKSSEMVNLLVIFLKNEEVKRLPIHFQSMVLSIIQQLVSQVPDAAVLFAHHGIVAALVSIIHSLDILEFDILSVVHCLDVLEKTTDVDIALAELTSVYSLQGCFYVLEHLLNSYSDHRLFCDAVTKCVALIGKITNNGPLNNAYHLRSVDLNVLGRLSKILPQHQEALSAVQSQLKAAANPTSKTEILQTSPPRTNQQQQMNRAPKLSISQLISSSVEAEEEGVAMGHQSSEQSAALVRYTLVPKMDPETNVFFNEKRIGQVSLDTTAEIVCGMLNSNKGGNIHIGLNSAGRVDGVRINADERDGFRGGLDQLFLQKLTPLIPASLVQVDFVPVFDPVNHSREEDGSSLYVVRLAIPANMNTLYYLRETQACFLRRGYQNVKLNLREVRQLAVSLTEKRFSQQSHT